MNNKILDLFCGIGGISKAFINAGFEVEESIDIDKDCIDTMKLNFNNHKITQADIKECFTSKFKRIKNLAVITAGFPCQSFSRAGEKNGLSDDRGQLIFDIIRATELIKPKFVFLENVCGLLSTNNGEDFKIILGEFEKIGYKYNQHFICNTCDYSNLPQNRKRVYIIISNKEFKPISIEKFSGKKLTKDEIINPVNNPIDDFLYYDRFQTFNQIQEQIEKDKNSFYSWHRYFLRKIMNNNSPTLTRTMGTGGHNIPIISDSNNRIRALTTRECLRLQGFPESFQFPKKHRKFAYQQIGNSVSVPVVEIFAKKLIELLNHDKS
jgi:DNA (cytosine-5)-methyltransferase 1